MGLRTPPVSGTLPTGTLPGPPDEEAALVGEPTLAPAGGKVPGNASQSVMGVGLLTQTNPGAADADTLALGAVRLAHELERAGFVDEARAVLATALELRPGLAALPPLDGLGERELRLAIRRAAGPDDGYQRLLAAATDPEPARKLMAEGPKGARFMLHAVQASVGNDFFHLHDDRGFTTLLSLAVLFSRLESERLTFSADLRQITERPDPDGNSQMRRDDDLAVLATYQRVVASAPFKVELGAEGGLGGYGNQGGLFIQNGFHSLPFVNGRTLQSGLLEHDYPDRNDYVVLLGGFVNVKAPIWGPLKATTGAGARVATVGVDRNGLTAGRGISHVRAFVGLELDTKRLKLEAGDQLWRYFTSDPGLTIPGGYVPKLDHSPFVRVTLPLRWCELGYEAILNEGNSGQGSHKGVVRVYLR